MNNKGFAITTILFGITLVFCMLMVSLLGILSNYRSNLEKLVENTKGARGTIIKTKNTEVTDPNNITEGGLYYINGAWNYYTTNGELSGS